MSLKSWFVIGLLAVAGTGYALRDSIAGAFASDEAASIEGAQVRRGPLKIDVVERGNLKAADSVDLKSEVEGQTTILFLVEEGTEVEEGDLLVELDTSDLLERRVSQEISVQNAEAAYIKAKQNLEIQESQNESELAKADRDLEFARADLDKYIEGDWPQELRRAEEEILLADEELTRATQNLEWSERLAEKGFLENTQLEADRLAKTRAEITLNQKNRALELLKQYEFPRQKRELESNVEERGRELDRVGLQARAKIVDHEASTRTSKARFDLETEKLSRLDSQIDKARIHAPVPGMVVYYQNPGRRWGNNEPIQEGSVIRERQEIITIPSTEGMVAEASLHESVLDRVKEGMPCVITVDAIPDRTFSGIVKYKALLPDQNSWWANPDLRVYRSEIRLTATDERLRPGMSCSIEILVDEIPDTLYMPLQSVFLDEGKTVAFVSDQGVVEKREVGVGQNNGKWVEVTSGLQENETVLLAQPAGFNLSPASLEQKEERRGPPGAERGQGGRPGGERGKRPGASKAASARSGKSDGRRSSQGESREGSSTKMGKRDGAEGIPTSGK